MESSLHNLTRGYKRTKGRRIGRGNASGHGTYAGRGQKGQRARSGGKGGLKLRAFKQKLQSIPKIGGFKSFYVKPQLVYLKNINAAFDNNTIITPKLLLAKGLIKVKGNRMPEIKILDNGEIKKKLIIRGCAASESAKKKIIAMGGTVFKS